MEEGAPLREARPELIAARVCQALNVAGARYLVIGGIACILHGYVRATTDIDVLIERTPDNAERVLAGLAETEYGFAREWSSAQLLVRPITVVGDDPGVDIFTTAWTVNYEDVIGRGKSALVEGVTIPFIGLDDLIATKRTGRLQDAADIEMLEEIKRALGS
jgi:predicted nucleotidyltransferase